MVDLLEKPLNSGDIVRVITSNTPARAYTHIENWQEHPFFYCRNSVDPVCRLFGPVPDEKEKGFQPERSVNGQIIDNARPPSPVRLRESERRREEEDDVDEYSEEDEDMEDYDEDISGSEDDEGDGSEESDGSEDESSEEEQTPTRGGPSNATPQRPPVQATNRPRQTPIVKMEQNDSRLLQSWPEIRTNPNPNPPLNSVQRPMAGLDINDTGNVNMPHTGGYQMQHRESPPENFPYMTQPQFRAPYEEPGAAAGLAQQGMSTNTGMGQMGGLPFNQRPPPAAGSYVGSGEQFEFQAQSPGSLFTRTSTSSQFAYGDPNMYDYSQQGQPNAGYDR